MKPVTPLSFGHLTFLFCGLFLLLACTKESTVEYHNDYVHSGIPTPPYKGVPKQLVENYVNKIYIDLIGQKPSEAERDSAVNYLMKNELNMTAREKIITDVTNTSFYKDRFFQINSDLLLNGMSYDEVNGVLIEYTAIRDLVLAQQDTFLANYFQNELNKIQNILDAPDNYENGSISLSEYYGYLVYNLIYDEINMGSENFVKSCFENFFKRSPTVSELNNGVKMVDGQPTSVLLREGKTKTDFISIASEDEEFYQGRVLDAYESLLLREPTSEELVEATQKFINSENYKQMQSDIVKTDEYAGFE